MTSTTSDAVRRTSKRVSTTSSAVKAPTSIDPTAIIANHATLTGIYPIKIGPRAVIHQYAKIVSGDGPIEIGEGCIVWEKAVVGGASEDEARTGDAERGVTLGLNVVVESQASVEAKSVGEGTIIEAFAKVGEGAVVGKVWRSNGELRTALLRTFPSPVGSFRTRASHHIQQCPTIQ
jgi:dynactin-6